MKNNSLYQPCRLYSPINSDPPVLVGGDQLRVTLLLVTFITRTFSGQEGGAEENSYITIRSVCVHFVVIISYFS